MAEANALVSSMCHLAIDTGDGTCMDGERKERRGEDDVWSGRAVTPRFIRAGAMKKLHACSSKAGMATIHHHHSSLPQPHACMVWLYRCRVLAFGRGSRAGRSSTVAVVGIGSWWRGASIGPRARFSSKQKIVGLDLA